MASLRVRNLVFPALYFSLFPMADVLAQELERYEEVIITATRTQKPLNAIPNSVRVVDQQALNAQLSVSTSLLDSLSFFIPSMSPGRQKMTSSGVSLRGRTPLYLVDSIPQSTPLRNGERSGFTIDPAFVERVEVIYGANAIQGVGATGGVINTVTRSAPESGELLREVGAELSSDDFEGNSYHYRTYGLVGKKTGDVDGLIGLAVDRRDLYHDGEGTPLAVDTTQGDTMDSLSWNLFGKTGRDLPNEQRVELSLNVFELEGDGDYAEIPGNFSTNTPASSAKGTPVLDPTRNEALNLALSYTNGNLAGGNLTGQVFYYDFYALYGGGNFGTFQDADIAPIGELYDQSALSSEKSGAKVTYVHDELLWEGLQVVTGLDYLQDETYQELAQTGRLWVPKMEYKGWAPFVQLEQALFAEQLRVSGGVRYENVTLDVPTFTTIASADNTLVQGGSPSFSEALKNLGVVYEPVDGLTLFASYAEGFTMPDAGLILRNVNKDEDNPTAVDPTVDKLVDLQPVVADNTEIGVNYDRSSVSLSASYFRSDSDLGSRIQVVDGTGLIRREKTEIDGVEFAASYRFGQGSEIGANYAALDGRYDNNQDGVVDYELDGRNISTDRLNAWVQTSLSDNLTGRLQIAKFFDRDFYLPATAYTQRDELNFEGYQLVDLLLHYQNDELGTFDFGIQNLLSEQYLTYYSQTVQHVNAASFVAGRGRVFSLGWKKQI